MCHYVTADGVNSGDGDEQDVKNTSTSYLFLYFDRSRIEIDHYMVCAVVVGTATRQSTRCAILTLTL